MGVKRSNNKATKFAYWPMMVKPIKDKVESCHNFLANMLVKADVGKDLPLLEKGKSIVMQTGKKRWKP